MKKELPVGLIKIINNITEKYKNEIEIIDNEKSIIHYSIKKQNNSGNYFFIITNFSDYYVNIYYKPESENSTSSTNVDIGIGELESFFENWINLVKEYNSVELIKSYSNNESINNSFTNNKLINISIENIKLFNNFKIDLSENVNIILGNNAFGKTTILQAIALSNIPDNGYEEKFINYDELPKYKTIESKIILQRKNEMPVIVNINKNKKYTSEIQREPIFLAYGVNIFTVYENINYDIIIKEIVNGDSDKWYYTRSVFEDFTDRFYDPLVILQKIEDNIFKKPDLTENIKSIILITLNKLLPKDFQIIKAETGTYYFTDSEKNLLRTSQLSEGYKNNIILLTDIVIRIISLRKDIPNYNEKNDLNKDSENNLFKKAKGIIAIDEFDRHLHPTWQKEYLSNLLETFPNIQFVVTTHNPVSIFDRDGKDINELVLNEKKEIVVKKYDEGTKNIDAGTILLTYFGLDSVISPSLQKDLDEYFALKIENNKGIRFGELEKRLDSTFLGIIIHDYRYLAYLKFIRKYGKNFQKRIRNFEYSETELKALEEELKDYL